MPIDRRLGIHNDYKVLSRLPDGKQNPEYAKRWREGNREIYRRNARRQRWKGNGLDPDEAERVYKSSSKCGICGKPIKGKNKHVDHNHKTKEIRGVLCEDCNRGIGMFKDNPNLLRIASNYLFGDTN